MIKFEDYEINAADLGKMNPLPDIKNVSYIHAGYEMTDNITPDERKGIGEGMVPTMLPYMLQDGYNRDRKIRKFKAVRMENEYLRAIFLPELGGRLWSLFDKKAGRELLYKNSVFQPANLALRNAWFSGGVEFNVGIKGHNPLTCSPMFAQKVVYEGGEVLKMYEFERIRQTAYSISAYLPDGSPYLYIRDCIENTCDEEKFTYWWSNIAVNESLKTRIIVPATESFLSSYNDGRYIVDKITVPNYEGRDLSYPNNSVRSQDYFYKIPLENAKWIAAVDGDGYGLLQFSDSAMIGRKLFVWGQGAGGRHWGEWLSEEGQSYVEIQAGLARTQLEHIKIAPHTKLEWTEAYGAVRCDEKSVHGDWDTARRAVENASKIKLEPENLDTTLQNIFPDASSYVSTERFCNGSGWGAMENVIRKKAGKLPVSDFCEFPADSFDAEQKQWIYLLENGVFPETDTKAEPVSYVSSAFWREPLEKAAQSGGAQEWYAWLQLGVHCYIFGELDKAKAAFEKSVAARKSCWGYRNLAVLYKNEYGDKQSAIKYIEKAIELNSDCRGILVDCAKIYTESGLDEKWISLYETLPQSLKTDGRIRLYKAIAHINLLQLEKACEIINESFVMCDIQEGEVSVSHIWKRLYAMKLSKETGITDSAELERLTNEKYPLPKCLDFRMHE